MPRHSNVPRISSTAAAIRASAFADLAPHLEAHARRGGKLVALHIGDTHLEPPEAARFRAAEPEHFDAALYRYGAVTGTASLREALLAHATRGRPGRRAILLGGGATHALFCAARAVLEAGDEVMVGAPYWPLAVGVVRAAGGVPIEVPLTQRLYTDPSLDAGALFEEKLTPRTRALYLISPNNPDGKVLLRGALESIARVAREHDLWVFSDEVYADYAYDAPHVSIAELDGMAERTLVARSLSKSHALAGARVGYVVGPEEAVAAAQRVSTHSLFNVPVVAQRVAEVALAAGDAWIAAARAEYRAARDEAAKALEGSGARFFVAEGGSYLFLDFTDLLGERPLLDLLTRAIDRGVLVCPGDACGAGFERWARLCFTAVPRPELLDGIARLRDAMRDLAR